MTVNDSWNYHRLSSTILWFERGFRFTHSLTHSLLRPDDIVCSALINCTTTKFKCLAAPSGISFYYIILLLVIYSLSIKKVNFSSHLTWNILSPFQSSNRELLHNAPWSDTDCLRWRSKRRLIREPHKPGIRNNKRFKIPNNGNGAFPRENIGSHLITEVNSCWAAWISGWVTILVSMSVYAWGSQVGVVFYISTSHLCNGTWVEFQSISTWLASFSPGTPVFLPL